MDAYNRRLNIFRIELKSDIEYLYNLIEKHNHEKIIAFAHKYKMRLKYFKYNTALNYCNNICSPQNATNSANTVSIAKELLQELNNILRELRDESISS